MNEMHRQFADRLSLLRRSQGMTQQTVADILNVSRPAYSYYESGKSEPSLESMRRLIRLFCPTAPRFLLLLDECGSEDGKPSVLHDDGTPSGAPLMAELNDEEQRIVGMYRVMDEEQRAEAVMLMMRLLNGSDITEEAAAE